ncbi:MAG TPA: rhodanese-like domain-containing protein [Bauldia sp.]|nr:rhodanese-like domain-containing protein [Bauldia sp.]
MSETAAGIYAGDVSAKAAYDDLARTPEAALVDVRTAAEWVYVGVPMLSGIGKETILVAWDEFPAGDRVPDFVGRLADALDRHGVGRDAPLYFICRSGNRSRKAAIEATAAGYRRCHNVDLGFEGRLDAERHRGTAGSWKAEGLPWVQS